MAVLLLAAGFTLLVLGCWAILRLLRQSEPNGRLLTAVLATTMLVAGWLCAWILAVPIPRREPRYMDAVVAFYAIPTMLVCFACCGLLAWLVLRCWTPSPGETAPPELVIILLAIGIPPLLVGWCGASNFDEAFRSKDVRIASSAALALLLLFLAVGLWRRIQPRWNETTAILWGLALYDLFTLIFCVWWN
jgi:hypothetical protein